MNPCVNCVNEKSQRGCDGCEERNTRKATIYRTEYDESGKTDHSVECEFESLGQVIMRMGEPTDRGMRWINYGNVTFSDFVFKSAMDYIMEQSTDV